MMHHNNMATLLDDSGILLTLPYDLTLPFARYIARNKITNLRRYNVSRVYRKQHGGGKPRELYECDFDIVSPKSSSSALNIVNEAEVLKVITEVMDHWPAQLGSYYIRVCFYMFLY
jgi:translation initiation factor 2-alpha kinase 4